MKTKTVLFALALTLVFTSCVRAQQSQQYDSEGDFLYEIRDGKVIITEYVGTKQEIRIPPQIRRTPVTEIGWQAFNRMYITSVVIPDSVIVIGESAFASNQLTSVIIGNEVTTIGNWAFQGNHLTSITIPNNVTTIGNGAFARNRLTSVVIPDSVTTIGEEAFANNRLTSVVIPNNVTGIGENVFGVNLPPLISNPPTSITIGANVIFLSRYDNFGSFYTEGGRRAGTYTFSNRRWSFN
jgi:hypothetical protein